MTATGDALHIPEAEIRAREGDKVTRLFPGPSYRKILAMVRRAVASGKLIRPDICSHCGMHGAPTKNGCARITGHHHDYTRPLDVEWLCRKCHRHETRQDRMALPVFGEEHGGSKLDNEAVKDILSSPLSCPALAKKYGVNRSTINRVRRKESWSAVNDSVAKPDSPEDAILRMAFEAWMQSNGYTRFDLRQNATGYESDPIHRMWCAYQAASAAQSAELARLRVLAGRYEWLRDEAHPDRDDTGLACMERHWTEWGKSYHNHVNGEWLDTCIDAALAQQQGRGD